MALFKRKPKPQKEADARKAVEQFEAGLVSIRDLVAPASMEIKNDSIELNGRFVRTLFVLTYPQYIETNWLNPVINYDVDLYISIHIYPIDSTAIINTLRRKVAKM